MTSAGKSPTNEPLYALSWKYAQDGKIAFDPASGTVIDANPAMEKLMGRSRDELIGTAVTYLHPESERELVLAATGDSEKRAALYTGFHIQHKDGRVVPVQIWCSDPAVLDGRKLAIVEFRDISLRLRHQLQLASQNWALSAFSGAALALSRARTEQELLQSICDAITTEPAYVLAFVSVAEPIQPAHCGLPRSPAPLWPSCGGCASGGMRLTPMGRDPPDFAFAPNPSRSFMISKPIQTSSGGASERASSASAPWRQYRYRSKARGTEH